MRRINMDLRDYTSMLETLCLHADLSLDIYHNEMAEVFNKATIPGYLEQFFYLIVVDPCAKQRTVSKVQTAFREYRKKFCKHNGLFGRKKERIVPRKTPHLLISIVLGENDVKLVEERYAELTKTFNWKMEDAFAKDFYDLRHGLFVQEDFILPELAKEPHSKADVSRKYIANAEFCAKNTPRYEKGFLEYYSSANFLVSLAGAYFNILEEGFESDEIGLAHEDINRFVDVIESAADTAAEERMLDEKVSSRLHNMFTKAMKEFEERRVHGHKRYCTRLTKAKKKLIDANKKRIKIRKLFKRI